MYNSINRLSIILLIILFNCSKTSAQNDNYSDEFLSSTFKIYYSADKELSSYMYALVEKRMVNEIKDTANFYNPYDKLSKYITIKMSPDKRLKLYCWHERDFGCHFYTSTYAQFKTQTNNIRTLLLGNDNDTGEYDSHLYLSQLHQIQINNKTHYLIIGYGGHCGNKKYQCARVYTISNDSIIKTFKVCAATHRMGELNMTYDSKTKILSYNEYAFDDDTGFYSDQKSLKQWKLTNKGFKEIISKN